MESKHTNEDPRRPSPVPMPEGWMLVDRFDRPDAITLRFSRIGTTRHWVTVVGTTYEEALELGRRRIQLYDDIERQLGR